MKPARDEALVARAVVEAIGAFAAPPVRARVLEMALRWARRPDIPERGDALREFVHNALFLAAEQVLGTSEATAIKRELEPIVEAVGRQEISEVRKSWPELPAVIAEVDAPDEPRGHSLDAMSFAPPGDRRPIHTQPAPSNVPLVLVASHDPGAVEALGRALVGHAILEVVRDALAMIDGSSGGQTATLVVVDCERPSVRVETLLALAPELPEGSRIILWGETPDLEQTLALFGAGLPNDWVRCGAGATAEDVAAVCRVLED